MRPVHVILFCLRPQELDAAVKRRFAKRLYIGLPCSVAREQMVRSLLSDQKHELTMEDVQRIAKLTDGLFYLFKIYFREMPKIKGFSVNPTNFSKVFGL